MNCNNEHAVRLRSNGVLTSLTAAPSGNIGCTNLRRKAHGHDPVIPDADLISDLKAARVRRMHQHLLPVAAVTDQQIAVADLKHTRFHGHSFHHGRFHTDNPPFQKSCIPFYSATWQREPVTYIVYIEKMAETLLFLSLVSFKFDCRDLFRHCCGTLIKSLAQASARFLLCCTACKWQAAPDNRSV